MIVFIIIMPEFSSVLKRYTLIKIIFNFENEKSFFYATRIYTTTITKEKQLQNETATK